VGIASYPLDANDGRTLMKQASLALRAAKRSGMNQVRGAEAPSKTGAERGPS
jgi:GGDEF domain-containing protein